MQVKIIKRSSLIPKTEQTKWEYYYHYYYYTLNHCEIVFFELYR